MKILIAYYSRTGNTKELIEEVRSELENKGSEVTTERIGTTKEPGFFATLPLDLYIMILFLGERLFKKELLPRHEIESLSYNDVSQFDGVIIASPKWGSVPPSVCKYLDEIKGLKDKKVGVVTTFYSPPLPLSDTSKGISRLCLSF